MCLYPTEIDTNNLKDLFKSRKRASLTFYKTLIKHPKTLGSVFRTSYWKSGYKYALANGKKLSSVYINDVKDSIPHSISQGIHVYLTKPNFGVVVPVVCHKDDLLGADLNEAVFSKVYLRQKTYDRIMDK